MNRDSPPNRDPQQVEATLRQLLGRRVRDLRVLIDQETVVLRGQTTTFYGKQLALHLARQAIGLPVTANEIEVV